MIDQQKIIGEWMETIIQNGSWQEDNDLHVDEINPSFSSPDTWITGGIQSIAVAIRFRDNKKLPFVVALGFSLRSSTNPIIIVRTLSRSFEVSSTILRHRCIYSKKTGQAGLKLKHDQLKLLCQALKYQT